MTRRRTILAIVITTTASLAACASPESVRTLSRAQRAAIEELALAWSDDHALLRANLAALLDIHLTAVRGRIHREMIETACIDPDGLPDTVILSAAIADPSCTIALVREVRTGRMTEAQAGAWLTDYATALRLGPDADGIGVRTRLLAQLAEIASIEHAWAVLTAALDDRAERVVELASQAAGASDTLAEALELRLAWRTIGGEVGATGALEPVIDALFTDQSRRAAARELLTRLLSVSGSEPNS